MKPAALALIAPGMAASPHVAANGPKQALTEVQGLKVGHHTLAERAAARAESSNGVPSAREPGTVPARIK